MIETLRRVIFISSLALIGVAVSLGPAAVTAAGRAVSPSSCRANDYRLSLSVLPTSLGVTARADVALVAGRSSCELSGTLRLALEQSGGLPVSGIARDPATWPLHSRLASGEPASHVWVWRNWCKSRGSFIVAASIGSLKAAKATAPPSCQRAKSSSVLLSGGDPIPAHVLPAGAPIPISDSIIHVTNAWLVSDGVELVAVYAGRSGANTGHGVFAIVRQNLILGTQGVRTIDVPAGPVRLTKVPTGVRVERTAELGTLHFAVANGQVGTLDLAHDAVQVDG